ncbi:50S ribosomal protein L11 methyltransferase [Aureibacillus halotolerans]|uniref:Ribosomal protein L11 methyltransferase n=1 Tax=Aureibacillus halotolerans TaxID=1508390 RepID=A0A4R6TX21_9BACI|nr:50S ribosomal protein L11 methyltransferase [Aureibacillus halotolerans]TDQ38051.1 [LSU ribosomal protein L11P]-lysine N-methyltransferase [Aureibacillus halotolerans]
MNWIELQVRLHREAVEALHYELDQMNASGIVTEDPKDAYETEGRPFGVLPADIDPDVDEDEVLVKAYFSEQHSRATIEQQVRTFIDTLPSFGLRIGKVKVASDLRPEEDWAHAWKTHYHPIRLTERVIVEPPWEPSDEKVDIRITMDPGMAFGTGDHATTALCVQALDKYLIPGQKVIDVGTGSGILAIAAAKLGASSVKAFDIDAMAADIAKQNVEVNGVASVVDVGTNHLLQGIEEGADVIVANILAEIVIEMASDAVRLLSPGGALIVSGIIEEKKELVAQALKREGIHDIQEEQQEGWVALIAKKEFV